MSIANKHDPMPDPNPNRNLVDLRDRYDTDFDDDYDNYRSTFKYYEFDPAYAHKPEYVAYGVNFKCEGAYGPSPKTSGRFYELCDIQKGLYKVFETEELAWKNVDSLIDRVFRKIRNNRVRNGRKVPEFTDFYKKWKPKFYITKEWTLERQKEINKLVKYKTYWDKKKRKESKV